MASTTAVDELFADTDRLLANQQIVEPRYQQELAPDHPRLRK